MQGNEYNNFKNVDKNQQGELFPKWRLKDISNGSVSGMNPSVLCCWAEIGLITEEYCIKNFEILEDLSLSQLDFHPSKNSIFHLTPRTPPLM